MMILLRLFPKKGRSWSIMAILCCMAGSLWADAPFSDRMVIDSSASGAVCVRAADFDGDGDQDLAASAFGISSVLWYQNEGGSPPQFTRQAVDSNILGSLALDVGDLNGDGKPDVAATARDAKVVYWYENGGGETPDFTRRTVESGLGGPVGIVIADIDGDKNLDIAMADDTTDRIHWFRNDGSDPPNFTNYIVDDGWDKPFGIHAADLDDDDDVDLIAAFQNGNAIVWYENDGGENPSFTPRTISGNLLGWDVDAADVDGDGAMDVLSVSVIHDEVSWHRNNRQTPPTFEPFVISEDPDGLGGLSDVPLDIVADDLDRDGDLDVLVASRTDKEISWYENDGAAVPGFTQHVLTNEADGAHGVIAADLDGDYDLDVAYASQFDGVVGWFENLLPPSPVDLLELERGKPTYGDTFIGIHWRTEREVAGTAVRFELWAANDRIADLGFDWHPDGEHTADKRLPLVAERADYRIIVRSVWDPSLTVRSEPFAILGGPLRLDLLDESVLWQTGSTQPVYWRSNPQISGTAVDLELWDATRKVADLGWGWEARGEGIQWITVPDAPSGDQYRMRAVSIWDPQYSVFCQDRIEIAGDDRRNAVEPSSWMLYR